jgi:sterol desaturase/sphingolipid hydroxylase (fatty acid hydroxylase superfamily)
MEQFLETPFHEPRWFLQLTLILFAIIFTRYLVVSGAYHYVFFVWFRRRLEQRILNPTPKQKEQLWMEIQRSAFTSVIFAIGGTAMIVGWQRGYTQIYTAWQDYPIWWIPLSALLALLIHETYYYWMHRWMHLPKVYRKVHKWHHDSIETSSLTAFSFHPIESILQAIIIPILVFLLPMHIYVVIFLLLLMTISATINHGSVELYPKNSESNWLGKWFIGATHHDLHHKKFLTNYGLYFTFWDRWMKTESEEYEQIFREKTK